MVAPYWHETHLHIYVSKLMQSELISPSQCVICVIHMVDIKSGHLNLEGFKMGFKISISHLKCHSPTPVNFLKVLLHNSIFGILNKLETESCINAF